MYYDYYHGSNPDDLQVTSVVKGFDELTKEYKKEHNERIKTERADRKKRYHEMLNSSKNVVADELVMTASHNFF